MEEALAAQLRASLPDAERLYRAALAIDPHAADALHMLGAICYQTGRLLEGYDLIRKALEETGWQIPMFRHNFALVLSSMLATDDAVEAMLSGEEELGARIEADSRALRECARRGVRWTARGQRPIPGGSMSSSSTTASPRPTAIRDRSASRPSSRFCARSGAT